MTDIEMQALYMRQLEAKRRRGWWMDARAGSRRYRRVLALMVVRYQHAMGAHTL